MALFLGPFSRALMVGIRLGKNLLDRKLRQVCGVAHAAVLGQQPGQR